ncbi:MAG: amidohydrolase [Fidelibacterota bacterium]|nr:MAG: amidohydrolase [Candidatus Neomarinimicrobiota bacterium]
MYTTICIGLMAFVFPPANANDKTTEGLKTEVISSVEALKPLIEEMATLLWDYSELALEETLSAKMLSGKLEKAGFIVERGVAGMPTAFVATYGRGKPVIGILAEYDALPGVGNEPVPRRQPRADGVPSGQGCGHNLFGAACVAAAIAVKNGMAENQLPGTIKLFGTPAEETVVGKVYMARDGIFKGLDTALEWHPSDENSVRNQPGRAMNNFEVEFFGQAAHASADPWNGRSALDAVELMNFGVNLMREHVKPTTRLHYVIPGGGEAPNVVPEYTRVWYYVRALNREEVQQYYDWVLKIAESAALATGTTHKVHLITGVHEYLLNRPLQEAIQVNLELVGTPIFTKKEQAFARSIQRFLKIKERGFSEELKPLADEPQPPRGGSTDVAEVSWMTPTAGFSVVTAPEEIPWHNWATTASHGTAASRKGAVIAAKVLAATGVDLLTRPELLKEAQKFFKEASGGKAYRSPIPANQPPPLK